MLIALFSFQRAGHAAASPPGHGYTLSISPALGAGIEGLCVRDRRLVRELHARAEQLSPELVHLAQRSRRSPFDIPPF